MRIDTGSVFIEEESLVRTKKSSSRNILGTVGPTFSPERMVITRTLADRVTETLMTRIVKREFPAGTLLPSEQSMAKGFGVSRTVIREAVSRLKSEGLIDTRQGRGASVRQDSPDVPFRIDLNSEDLLGSLLHIIELRRGLDAEIAFLAAERRRNDQMIAIRRALAEIDRALKAGQDGVAEDLNFHLSIAQAARNPLFPELIRFLSRFLYDAMRVTHANENRRAGLAEQVRSEHTAIADAIARRDAEAAATAAKTHMINAALRIQSADRDFWTTDLRRITGPAPANRATKPLQKKKELKSRRSRGRT